MYWTELMGQDLHSQFAYTMVTPLAKQTLGVQNVLGGQRARDSEMKKKNTKLKQIQCMHPMASSKFY